jgi:hypothetical protein
MKHLDENLIKDEVVNFYPKRSDVKQLAALALLLLFPLSALAQQAPPAASAQVQTPDAFAMQSAAEMPHPEKYAVAFLPMQPGDASVAFMVAPSGRIGTIPDHFAF